MRREEKLAQELQEVQNDLQQQADYEEKEYASDVIRAYARWYENYPPTENLTFPFNFKASQVQNDPYTLRLLQSFSAAGKVLTITFV